MNFIKMEPGHSYLFGSDTKKYMKFLGWSTRKSTANVKLFLIWKG